MFLQSLIHMISLVKMHEDSEYEIFRLAESKNCFEMSFSPCVIILSFRRRPLMMNTKRYVGKKKKKHSWMISTTHPEAPEEIIKINKSNVQRKDWLTGCFFLLFISLFIWWRKLEQVCTRRGWGDMIHWDGSDTRLLKSLKPFGIESVVLTPGKHF